MVSFVQKYVAVSVSSQRINLKVVCAHRAYTVGSFQGIAFVRIVFVVQLVNGAAGAEVAMATSLFGHIFSAVHVQQAICLLALV